MPSGFYAPNGSGRGRRLAEFDAPFNMGSAECKIEWNDNFDATYLGTKRNDNMNFSTRIQKNILSQHAKSWYSRENIVLLSVVLTCHLGTCIPAKKRMPN